MATISFARARNNEVPPPTSAPKTAAAPTVVNTNPGVPPTPGAALNPPPASPAPTVSGSFAAPAPAVTGPLIAKTPRKRRTLRAAEPAAPAAETGAQAAQPPIDVPSQVAPGGGEIQPDSALPHEKRAAEKQQALATVPKQEVGAPAQGFGGDSDISMDDIQMPRIHIVQKVGDLSEQFEPGEIVLNRATPLPQPLPFVVLGFKPKIYVERIEGGNGRICRSLQEVAAAGGTTNYEDAEARELPLFQTMATGIFAIQYQEVKDDAGALLTNPADFPYEDPEGGLWVVAQYSMKGTAYTNAAKPLYTARMMGRLRKDWTAVRWGMETKMEKFKTGNWAAKPVLTILGDTTPAWREWVKQTVFGATVVDE